MNIDLMIDLLNKDLMNEWKHLRFYLYHASTVTGFHREEYRELFLKEANGEMQHVTEFCDLIIGLGGTPTVQSNEFEKFSRVEDIMIYALKMEEEVVENYVKRLKQAQELGGVNGTYLEIFLENQIEKSRQDVDHFKLIIKN